MKFTAKGKLSMTLGKPGIAGDGPDVFNDRRTFSSHRVAKSSLPMGMVATRMRAL